MFRPSSMAIPIRFMAAFIVSLIGSWVQAADAPPFPTDPNVWINSGPLSVSGLKGKGIVLWFFEEEDLKVRQRWPAIIESAKKFETKPVVFIAVNSGTQRGQLEAYVREMKIPWPVLADQSRDFEKACNFLQEIGPENVSQIRYIKPDGEIQAGLTDDIEETAEKAGEGAEWKMDPSMVPDPLRASWMAVEIGNYKGLAAALKKSSASPKAEVKDVATKLSEIIQKEITDQMALVTEAQQAENPFKAYELVSALLDRFVGFDVPKEAATLKKDLTKDPKVKAGLAAIKNLEGARKQLAGGNPALKKKAMATLQKIVADFPESSIAHQAKALIDYAN